MGSFNYSANVPLMSDNSWQSNPTFSYSLLSGVYEIAEKNLHNIFPSFKDLTSCNINQDDLLDFQYCGDGVDAESILDDFSGVFSYIVVWLIFGLIFTFVGIIWCLCNKCCCCCGTGDKNKIEDLVNTDPEFEIAGVKGHVEEPSKTQLYLQIIVGVLMALWIIGFSFSVFTAFASNESLRRSIFEFQDDVNKPLNDAEMYLNITTRQIHAVFVTSYGNLSDQIQEIAPNARSTDFYRLGNSKIQKLMEATEIYNSTFRKQQFSMEAAMSLQFTGISNHLESMKSSLETEVTPLFKNIDQQLRIAIAQFEGPILATGEQLKANSEDLIKALDEIPVNETRQDIEDADKDVIEILGSSIYGSFMAFNIVILAILIGIIMGYVVTWIGKGSAKKTGFIFYRFTIATMFTIGWIVTIAMISGFFGAGFFSQIVCETIKDFENNASSTDLNTPLPTQPSLLNVFQAQPSGEYDVPSYGHIIRSCKNGASAYIAMDLKQVYDIESIFNISDNFANAIISRTKFTEQFFIKNVEQVYSTLEKDLIALQESTTPWSNLSGSITSESERNISELRTMYSQIEFQLIDILNQIKTFESEDILRQSINQIEETIIHLVEEYEQFVNKSIIDDVGQCEPLYVALNATVHIFCYKVLAPVATYWWSLQFLLIMFVAVISTALINERLLK